MYMSTVPLATARAELSRIVEEAVATHERVEITRNGVRAAVLLAADDYDEIIETIEILSDPTLMADIADGLRDVQEGRTVRLEEVRDEGERR